jgi:hypothetical protein
MGVGRDSVLASAKAEICKMCGSVAVLYLSSNEKGRHCDNCGAGWYVIPRKEEKANSFEELKLKVKKAAKEARAWAKREKERIRDQNPDW